MAANPPKIVATELSLSPSSSCAQFSDSTARCWGDVSVSETVFGIPTKERGARKQEIVRDGAYSEVISLMGFVCLRRASDSGFECRENELAGQPAQWHEVPGLEDTGPFSNNGWTACAGTSSGSIRCIDIDAREADRYVLETVELGDFDASEVFVGAGHLGVLTNSGDLLTFGINLVEPEIRIGLELPVSRTETLPELQGATRLDVGVHFFLEHGVALFPDGRVFTCGEWSDATGWKTGLEHATDVSVGDVFACAIREDKRVLCWGEGGLGALGDGSTQDRAEPEPIPDLEATRIVAASAHACAISRDGRVFCSATARMVSSGRESSRTAPCRSR